MPQQRKYKWYTNVGRYRDKAGRFVSERNVASHIDNFTRKVSAQIYKGATDLVDNFSEAKFAEWSRTTRQRLVTLHNAATVIALGGKKASLQFAQQNAAAWSDAEHALGEQLRYFDRFMLGVVSGAVPLKGNFAVRAAMYPLAAYGTYQNASRIRNQIINGYTEEMRILQSGNPCPDCITEAGKGWQPIGTLRRIGDSVCISRCRCYFKYRKRATNNE